MNGISPDETRHLWFNLTVREADNLFESADGMRSYRTENHPDWEGFPSRSQDAWGVGFTDDYSFLHGNKNVMDGVLSFEEAQLANHQLAWDREAISGCMATTNAHPIQVDPGRPSWALSDQDPASGAVFDQAGNASNFLSQIFDSNTGQVYAEFDTNGDGQFTQTDMTALAALDGDAEHLSSSDLDVASGLAPAANAPAETPGNTAVPEPNGVPNPAQVLPVMLMGLQLLSQMMQLQLMMAQFPAGQTQQQSQ